MQLIAANCTALVATGSWDEATAICYTIREKVAEWTEDAFWVYDVNRLVFWLIVVLVFSGVHAFRRPKILRAAAVLFVADMWNSHAMA